MFQRTYRPLVDGKLQTFVGFESKAKDFDSGCSVARVGTMTEGGGADPEFYDIFAVELRSKRFLFKVEIGGWEIGEVSDRTMRSVAIFFCDRDPVSDSSARIYSTFKTSRLNQRCTTHYCFSNHDEFRQITDLLKDGVRRLNFSCDASHFARNPVEYCAEFRLGNPPSSFRAEQGPLQQPRPEVTQRKSGWWGTDPGPDLASLLAMKRNIEASRLLEKIGHKLDSSFFSNPVSKEGEIDRHIEVKHREFMTEAEAWIDRNDRESSPDSVLATLSHPSNKAKLTDLEWVLAQLVALEPKASGNSEYPLAPANLEKVVSEPSVQKIFRSIYADQFEASIASFGTFLSQILFALTEPYIIRRDQLAASRVKRALAKDAEDRKKTAEILAESQSRNRPGPDLSNS